MADMHETAVSLRFHGDELDPEKLSRELGGVPTTCARKGALQTMPNEREITARTGCWILSVPRERPGDVEKQIGAIFSALSNDRDAWKSLSARYGGNIFVGLFMSGQNEGLSLSPSILDAVASRGLRLDLDIYGGQEQVDL